MSASESTRTMNVEESDDESDYEHQESKEETKQQVEKKKDDAFNKHNENPFGEDYKNSDLVRIIAKSTAKHDAKILFKDRVEYEGAKEDVEVQGRCGDLMDMYKSISGIRENDAHELMYKTMKKHRKRVYKKRSVRRLKKAKSGDKKKKNRVDTAFQQEMQCGLNKPIAFMIGERNDLLDTSDEESDSELATTFKKSHDLHGKPLPPKTKQSTPVKKQAAEQEPKSSKKSPKADVKEAAEDKSEVEAVKEAALQTVQKMYERGKMLENAGDILGAVHWYYKAGELGHDEAYADLAFVLNRKENRNIPNPENGHVVYKGQDHVYDNADDAQIRAEYCKEYYEIAAKRGSWHSKYRLKFHPFVSKEDRGKRTLWDDIINAGEAAGEFYYLAVWRKYDNYINYRRVSESDKLHAFEMLRSVAPHCDDAMKAVVEWIIPIRMIRGAPGRILDNITSLEQIDISIKALIKISRSKKVSQLKGRETKLWWIKVYEHIKMNPLYNEHKSKETIEKLREIVEEINNLMNMRYMRREQREQSLNELLQRLRDVPVESDP